MADIKFTLLHKNENYTTGTTNLKQYIHCPLNAGGCTILVCTEGMAIISIDFRKQVMKAGDITFLFADRVFIVLRVSSRFSAFYCTISSRFLDEATYNTPWDFYKFLYAHPVCSTTKEQYLLLMQWKEQMSWFIKKMDQTHQYPFMRNCMQNLFLAVDSEIKQNPDLLEQTERKDRAWTILTQFFALLLDNCYKERSVSFYANKLCITPYYLYKITYKILKFSPKEVIDQQIIVEIKMHLTCTDMSIKEIAEKLHFEDSSYMCRFFRRNTGRSLTDYRSSFM